MHKYRVAIVGCRSRGTVSGRAYHAHPRADVVGLCDLLPERSDELGEELGVGARFQDADVMIRETEPDIVVISIGTKLHFEVAMQALQHGVNIDIEKPLCVDLEQADQVLCAAEEHGGRVAVHHQGRTGAVMRAISAAFAEGRIGRLRHIHVEGKGYYGGLDMMNIGTHMINMLMKLAGHCHSLSATASTASRAITPDDVLFSALGMGTITGEHLTALLDFQNGVTATLLHHRQPEFAMPTLEICGEEGRLMIASMLCNPGQWNALHLPARYFRPDGPGWQRLDDVLPESWDREGAASVDDYWFVEEYVAALDADRDHECSGAEGLHVLEIMMGVFESAAYGGRVRLPQENREHPLIRWRREHGLQPPTPMPYPYGEWLEAEELRQSGRSTG